ncbi:MAG: glycosyltransferase family 4 protein [Solobacterium sp.]|nr:glycosyltransferase family 4 protein [Solobacterium sp.]
MDLKCFFGTFGAVFTQKGIHEGAKRERKKILLITNHSYMLYRFRLDLIKKLMEEHEVVLSMPFVGHEEDFQALGLKCINTPIDRRGINPFKDYALYRNYRRQLKEEAPDLVITYSIKPNIYAGYLAGRMNIPYVAMVQGLGTAFKKPVLASLVTVMYRTALRRAYRVLFENGDNARLFAEKNIVDPRKEVILNGAGINLTYFDYKKYPDNDVFRFLYVGRFMNEKGCGELFEAVRRLHSEKVPFVLDLAGFYEDDFKEQVESLKTLGIVNDHGFVTDPRPIYELSDCVVMPSWHEGMSNVLLEAAALGRPIITPDIPGCREAVVNGVSGLLCRVQDTDSLYEAMKKMLSIPREQREAMGREGREHMRTYFRKEDIVEQTMASLPEGL